jgi:SAM-dependent methyltransferase
MMDVAHAANDEQAKLWNGLGGRNWVEARELLDAMLKPFEDLLVQAVSDRSAVHVLDVGCGAGSTTLAVARIVGANGRSVGIDISEPLIGAARARAEQQTAPARFIHADAQTYPFEPASFDMIISRFGVMFFDDPARAFANLRRAAGDGAELRFIAWRSAGENPFMTAAERAAAPLLPKLPARTPNAPGQFAFADQHRVRSILVESGWTGIDIAPLDVPCTLPAKDLVRHLSLLGPVGRALQEADELTRARVIETVQAAFDPYVHGVEVRFTAACWQACARARSSPAAGEE